MVNFRRVGSPSAGFTLVELLIAVTILSMLLLTASYSYSLIASRWDKDLGNYAETTQQAKSTELLLGVLSGVRSYVVRKSDLSPGFLFIGADDSLLAATTNGLKGGDQEVFRLTVVSTENEKYDLVYQAVGVNQIPLVSASQEITFDFSTVLFKDAEQINFRYYGWPHLFDKTDENSKAKLTWQNRYSGLDAQYMPYKIAFEIIKDGMPMSFVVSLERDVEGWISPYIERDH